MEILTPSLEPQCSSSLDERIRQRRDESESQDEPEASSPERRLRTRLCSLESTISPSKQRPFARSHIAGAGGDQDSDSSSNQFESATPSQAARRTREPPNRGQAAPRSLAASKKVEEAKEKVVQVKPQRKVVQKAQPRLQKADIAKKPLVQRKIQIPRKLRADRSKARKLL